MCVGCFKAAQYHTGIVPGNDCKPDRTFCRIHINFTYKRKKGLGFIYG